MIHLTLVTLAQFCLAGAGEQDYGQAYRQSQTTGRPMVVLIGATWCPACQRMRNSILPEVAETGGLEKVVFVYVDFDRQRQLASRLTRGGAIPQLFRFDPTPAGWKGKRLTGAKSPREVHEFINAGLPEQTKASRVSAADRRANDSRKSVPGEELPPSPAGEKPSPPSLGNAPARSPSQAGSSAAEATGRLSFWAVFLRKISPQNANRHEGAVPPQDRLSEAGEDGQPDPSSGTRAVGEAASESAEGRRDIARPLADLVSGQRSRARR